MLIDLLVEKKNSIADDWVQRIIGTYPQESRKFLKSQKDQFANPVGNTISVNAEKIFAEMINRNDPIKLKSLLDEIIKIRAVQSFSPSLAVGFVFSLKDAVRDELARQSITASDGELSDIYSRIDKMALIVFDSYMESREKIFRIRLDEVKAKSFQSMMQKGSL